jgi:LacI family transcriptional regulator
LSEHQFTFRPELALEGVHVVDSESGRAMMRTLIESGQKFDGVVGVSDGKTIGAMMAAEEAGLEIGNDVQFISIDNTVAEFAPHPLSSVSMAFEEAGRLAAAMAISQLLAPRGTPIVTQCKLTPTLITR